MALENIWLEFSLSGHTAQTHCLYALDRGGQGWGFKECTGDFNMEPSKTTRCKYREQTMLTT